MILNVLIACEESQVECTVWRALGHRAFSCDVQPCAKSGTPTWHIQGDVRPFLHGQHWFKTQDGVRRMVPRWDLIIAHPPCTYLCRTSGIHLFRGGELNEERYKLMQLGREFFMECLNADAPYVCVENPVPLEIAQLPRPTTYVEPSWYGDRFTKKTLYWLKNLPPLMPTVINPNATPLLLSARGKYRSRTSRPMALHVALQWNEWILKDMANKSVPG